MAQRKAALFVDFDNIYLRLRQTDPRAAEQEYDLTDTSKSVRDHLLAQGAPVSRTSVRFVRRGLTFVGHPLGAGPRGNTRRKQVATLCDDSDLRLMEDEESPLSAWFFVGPSR